MGIINIHKYENKFSEKCSSYLFSKIKNLLDKNESISVALSGGNTPLPILERLANFDLDWNRINFFMTDERDVDLDSDESNYKNLNYYFIKKINSSLFPIRSSKNALQSVNNYSKYLNEKFNNKKPIFDLILLGMGEDGHIASLFPNSEAVFENKKMIVVNYIKELNSKRFTLTFPLIENSHNIILITKGKVKENIILERVNENLPIQRLINKCNINWLHSN